MAETNKKEAGLTNKKEAGLAVFEAGLTALGLGYVHGRKGTMPEKAKIPLDGAVAAVGILAGTFGGKYVGGEGVAKHLRAAGTGALSYFLGSLGGQWGQKARFKAKDKDGKSELQGPPLPAWLPEDQRKAAEAATPWRNNRTITAGIPNVSPFAAAQRPFGY